MAADFSVSITLGSAELDRVFGRLEEKGKRLRPLMASLSEG